MSDVYVRLAASALFAVFFAVDGVAWADDTVLVVGQGDPAVDTPALQQAVDTHEVVEVQGSFLLGDSVQIERGPLAVRGVTDAQGDPPVVRVAGGVLDAFLVEGIEGTLSELSISGIRFEDSTVALFPSFDLTHGGVTGGRIVGLRIAGNWFVSTDPTASGASRNRLVMFSMFEDFAITGNHFARSSAFIGGPVGLPPMVDGTVRGNEFTGSVLQAMYFQLGEDVRIVDNEVSGSLGSGFVLCCSTDLRVEGNRIINTSPGLGRWFALMMARDFEDALVVDNDLCGAGLLLVTLGSSHVDVQPNRYDNAWDADIGVMAYSSKLDEPSLPGSCDNRFETDRPADERPFVQRLDDDVLNPQLGTAIQACPEGHENEYVPAEWEDEVADNIPVSEGMQNPPTAEELQDLLTCE